MSKIICLIGESGSGKDTMLKMLLENNIVDKRIVSTTTRPMRVGEQEGREYYFITEEEYYKSLNNNEFIEQRVYHTINGDWYYGVRENSIDFNADINYVTILDYDGYVKYKEYIDNKYNNSSEIIPVFLYAPLQERIRRSIVREGIMNDKQCLEVCRRMIADNKAIGIHIDDCEHVLISDDEHKEYNIKYIKELLEEM